MKQAGNMNLYSLEEVTDELTGKVGTPERDEFDRSEDEAPNADRTQSGGITTDRNTTKIAIK